MKIPRPEQSIDSYPFEFSGGMRQRAMTAMALVCEPKLLIADEPTTALDVTTQAEILDLMKGLQSLYGMALMFITHDMGVVAEIADDVAVMHQGKVVEQGPVERHLLRPSASLYATPSRLGSGAWNAALIAPRRAPVARRLPTPFSTVERLGMRFEGRRRFFGGAAAHDRAGAGRGQLQPASAARRSASSGRAGRERRRSAAASCASSIRPRAAWCSKAATGRRSIWPACRVPAIKPFWQEMRMIFQDPFSSLNPRMTVLQIIGEPLRNYGVASARRSRIGSRS